MHKSADSLSVHKARMARPRFAQDTQAEDEEDELELQDEQPDSPAPDTEVQARVDSIALAQKRLNAKSSEKSRFDNNKTAKSRFGQVKLPDEPQEPASDEKKIKVTSGTAAFSLLQYVPSALSVAQVRSSFACSDADDSQHYAFHCLRLPLSLSLSLHACLH